MKKWGAVRLLFYFFTCLICSGLFASICFSQVIGTSVQIGTVTVECHDALGNQVVNHSGFTGQAAMSSIIGGWPAIVLDFQSLSMAPLEFSIFTYAHECAHHTLGHIIHASFAPVPQQEFAADCLAAKFTRDHGFLSHSQFDVAMSVLNTFPGDIAHPPGPDRVQNAISCYTTLP